MTKEEIKNEIVEELAACGNCSLCRKLGIYDNCRNSSCNEFLTEFFSKLIEINKLEEKSDATLNKFQIKKTAEWEECFMDLYEKYKNYQLPHVHTSEDRELNIFNDALRIQAERIFKNIKKFFPKKNDSEIKKMMFSDFYKEEK